ncbi:MAG: RsmB/NOP family class I SAM-dependent RNA methyltransferase [Parasphingopyxis sp.]|uniref:RsmB/NOP family class I SAM-dependent RNA methyltransferase n=1 Tax=Parasphingopyxis sp. TaxID=1920299 RepID=UPI003F9F6841
MSGPDVPGAAQGVESRRAALQLLDAVLRQGKSVDAAMGRAFRHLKRADDRGLAAAIAGEVLRRLPDYDRLIDSATQRPLPDNAKARMVLRMALAQALALGTPHHAAISTALPLLAGGPKRLAHGVFGTLSRQDVQLPEIPALPDPVALRWRDNWGDAMVSAAARAIAAPPPLDLTLTDPAATAEWADRLGGRSLIPGHVRCERASVVDLPGYADGQWWVQDISASLPARLFGAGEGRQALDLCAAPGGKTLQLAAQGWRVTALDRAESRLARLSDNLERTGLSAELVTADALHWATAERYDAILIDAPCSATGIFRRHPDVLYRATPRIIAESAEIQMAMLDRALRWLKPGGVLVYAVCSLEPAEGETVAQDFLAAHPAFAIDPVDPAMLPAGLSPSPEGWLRILPGQIADPGGADGFFLVRFRHS